MLRLTQSVKGLLFAVAAEKQQPKWRLWNGQLEAILSKQNKNFKTLKMCIPQQNRDKHKLVVKLLSSLANTSKQTERGVLCLIIKNALNDQDEQTPTIFLSHHPA